MEERSGSSARPSWIRATERSPQTLSWIRLRRWTAPRSTRHSTPTSIASSRRGTFLDPTESACRTTPGSKRLRSIAAGPEPGLRPSPAGFTRWAAGAAVGPLVALPDGGVLRQPGRKVGKWAHFLPGYDGWFAGVLAEEWGRQHDTKVVVDHIPVERIHAVAAAEIAAGSGHDVFMFPWPPAEFQKHVIDHAEIDQTVAFKFGNLDQLEHRSTFDPRAKQYFAFTNSC